MVCSCVHGPADPFWHVPFVLWVYGHGLTRLGHNLHAGILPFQAPEYPAEEVDSGDFGGELKFQSRHMRLFFPELETLGHFILRGGIPYVKGIF